MKIISFTPNGCELNIKLCNALENAKGYSTKEIEGLIKISLKDFAKLCFEEKEDMVFIGATGIAVRGISKHLKDKFTDPSVVVIDEKGEFVISLLSGHVGGGNELTLKISEVLKATPVITTATDVNKVFAVDVFAKKNNLFIENRVFAKEISANLLENKEINFCCDSQVLGKVPKEIKEKEYGEIGFFISPFKKNIYNKTLHLVPQVLTVGIGCRRNIGKDAIEEAVNKAFEEANLFKEAIKNFSSIDIKKDEKALIEYAKEMNKPIEFFSADELKLVEGEFSASKFVQSITSVDNVCERSSVLLSKGELIVKKTSLNGVTVAVSIEQWRVYFE